jgi:uncharacterized protein YeaO (DUF488 family)
MTRKRNLVAAAKRKPGPRRRTSIRIKRVYETPAAEDGLRILIDRLWPRGLTKSALKLNAWVKDLSPSTALRHWYAHDAARFAEFRRRYRSELSEHKDQLSELRATARGRIVTLVTSTRELQLSHAHVLRELLTRNR